MVLRSLWLLVLKWLNYLNCLRSGTKVWKTECICEKEGNMLPLYSLFRREHLFEFQSTASHFLVNQNWKRCGWWNYRAWAPLGWAVVNLTLLCRKLLCRIMSPFDFNVIDLKFQAGPFWGWGTLYHNAWDIFFCLAESSLDSCCPTQVQKCLRFPCRCETRKHWFKLGVIHCTYEPFAQRQRGGRLWQK